MSINVRSCTWQGSDFQVIVQYGDPTEAAAARQAAESTRLRYPIKPDAQFAPGVSRHVPSERCYERPFRFLNAR